MVGGDGSGSGGVAVVMLVIFELLVLLIMLVVLVISLFVGRPDGGRYSRNNSGKLRSIPDWVGIPLNCMDMVSLPSSSPSWAPPPDVADGDGDDKSIRPCIFPHL